MTAGVAALSYGAVSSQQSINWGSLRGVNYGWSALGASCAGNAPNPSTSFPQMKANGWNLIRVPIGWDLAESNPSNFASYMSQIASAANANGFYVIYDFHSINDCGWPSGVASQYSTTSALYSAWWANQVTYNGQNGWQAQFNDFWKPIISAVDSHASTLAYEIMNEPPGTGSQEQPYNQFVYNNIRALSSKVIMFGAPFNCPGCGATYGTAPAQAAEPNGINIAMDVHDYDSTGSTLVTHIQEWNAVSGLVGIVMGEFGPRLATSQSAAQAYLLDHYTAIKNGGLAATEWWWECGASLTGTGKNFDILLDSSCNQWWIDSAIVQAQNQVYGGSSTVSFTSSSSQSSSQSVSVTTITSGSSTITSTITTSSAGGNPLSILQLPQISQSQFEEGVLIVLLASVVVGVLKRRS